MGKKTRVRKKRAQVKPGSSSGTNAPAVAGHAQTMTLGQAVAQAEEYRGMMEYSAAISLYRQALSADPTNLSVLDALGGLLLEVGDVDSATEMLQRSIQLAPDENASKYMYLGQVQEGAEAVECFEKGITIMQRDVARLEAEAVQPGTEAVDRRQRLDELRRGLCSGHCAIAEVLLPDADTTEQIYARCESSLQQAQQWDAESPEPHQCMANLLLGQGRADPAYAALQTSIRLTAAIDDPTMLPSFGFRMGNAKMLLELGRWEEAVAAFEALLRTEDEDVELWYMLALSHGLGGDVAAASECLQRAMALLDKNADADSTGQLRGQVLAAVQEIEAQGPAPSAEAASMQSDE